MLDQKQLKALAIRFGRQLQLLFRTVGMFSVDYPGVAAPLQNTFDSLNALLKETGQFTFGFVDQRIMLNNVLTTERSLASLEDEFLKRGFITVTFRAGITLAAFKRGIAVLAGSRKTIEAAGGLTRYLEQNPLELMSIIPASKSQTRTEGGDTVLGMDAESYVLTKMLRDESPEGVGTLESFDSILRSAGVNGGEAAAAGTGAGVVSNTGPGSTDSETGPGGTGEGNSVIAPGGGPSGPTAAGLGPRGSSVEAALQATLLDTTGAPQRSFRDMVRALQEMQPEFVLSAFPQARREQLRALPPDQMAAEIIEDTAVKWTAQHLAASPTGPHALSAEEVEEEVMRVLQRILQTTKAAERLVAKLAQCFKNLLPATTTDRIQEELEWVMVPQKEKIDTLLSLKHFDRRKFRRLRELLSELTKGGDQENVTRLANHYMRLLEPESEALPEEINRIPDLFAAVASVRSDFWQKSADLLAAALRRPENGARPASAAHGLAGKDSEHSKILQFIVALANKIASYEEFAVILRVGSAVEELAAKDPENHQGCCGATLPALLTPRAIERLIEIYREKRDDIVWARTTATLLRWSGPAAINKVFQQLEDEQVAFHRFALMRLLARIGPSALDLARQRLTHERWYVVRNTCKLLVELKDPDLLHQLAPVLRHPDERAQRAAMVAIMESRLPARSLIFAEALPYLHPHGLIEVLNDLLFLKDPAVLPELERFIFDHAHGKAQPLMMAVQVLAVIPGERTERLLGKILTDSTLDPVVRHIAMITLAGSVTPASAEMLREFITGSQDTLAQECENTLRALGRCVGPEPGQPQREPVA